MLNNYAVVKITPAVVWIEDRDAGGVTVTNSAEEVVREVDALHPGRRIIYRDTMGIWDELVHRDGRFLDFAPAPGMAP